MLLYTSESSLLATASSITTSPPSRRRIRGSIGKADTVLAEEVFGVGVVIRADVGMVVELLEAVVEVDTDVREGIGGVHS